MGWSLGSTLISFGEVHAELGFYSIKCLKKPVVSAWVMAHKYLKAK